MTCCRGRLTLAPHDCIRRGRTGRIGPGQTQTTPHRRRGEPPRNDSRMVRLLPLRHRRKPGVQPTLLSRSELVRRHDAVVRDLRRRIRRQTHRRRRVRALRRPDRPEEDARSDDVHHGHRHGTDGRVADDRTDRRTRTDPSAPSSDTPGLRTRWRMGRRRTARRRAQSGEEARPVRKHPADRTGTRLGARHSGVRASANGVRRRRLPRLRMAHRVPAQLGARGSRPRGTPESGRDTGVPGSHRPEATLVGTGP